MPRQVASRAGFEHAPARSAARGWPVETRRTGGGTTPQGLEILNIALVRRGEPGVDATATYTGLCRLVVDAVRELGLTASIGPCPGAFCDGGHNVLLDGRKLAGTAQRWRRMTWGSGHAILAHALIVLAGALDASLGPSVEHVELDALARSSGAPGRRRAIERTARVGERVMPIGIA